MGISELIKRYLGIEDESVVDFIQNLYLQSQGADYSSRLQSFQSIVRDNGGEDFPNEFTIKVFDELQPKVKSEALEFPALNISNSKVEPIVKKELDQKLELNDDKKSITSPQMNSTHKNIYKSKIQPIKQENLRKGQIYQGYVTKLVPYGAFIQIQNYSGLCHISKISVDGSRTETPHDVLKVKQQVFVRVENIETGKRDRITLSMQGINQETGEEVERGRKRDRYNEDVGRNTTKRRLTSPERWEIKQLIASGVVSSKDYPELEEDDEDTPKTNNVDVDIDIVLTNEEPKFLKGQLHNKNIEPNRIVQNPQGSLNRVASQGSQLVREIKEARLQEQKDLAKTERIEKNKGLSMADPLSKTEQETTKIIDEWRKIQKNVNYGKRTTLPMKQQRESLPVFTMRSKIIEAVKSNQFLVVVGETGSGKTTQIVQYLAEEGLSNNKLIGCTQPRRVAAVSVAQRVAEEVGSKVGDKVGYTIRFEDKTSPNTVIKYMTDGILQKEAITDPDMSKYSVIMLDEAHERTIATDVLFVLLKEAAAKNPDLRIIITSATLDSDKFSKYFNNCPIMHIPGRTFPVEILYTKEPEMDYLAATLDTVMQIHMSEGPGDILVFLTGQEEIDIACENLYSRIKNMGSVIGELIILPVYSALPQEMQSKIFEPTPEGSRKVVIATNIAETSITIDGIRYVVDPGFVKVNAYDPRLGMDSLIIQPISQAQARQRSGRAGRTGPGKCYRLYTETAFNNEMLPTTIPEIQRQNLTSTLLMLKAMGINDLIRFEFMDPPSNNALISALEELFTLQALNEDGIITAAGRQMADFPMSPALAKTLIASADYGCSQEIITIVAMLSVQTIFYRPRDKQAKADAKKAKFHSQHGDHLTLLNVYNGWERNGYSRQWCQENFIQERSMRKAQEVKKQLFQLMGKSRLKIESCGLSLDKVRRALCSGFFKYSAKRDPLDGGYKSIIEQTPVHLHPSSALFSKNPEYVIYHTLLLTTKEYMQCVTKINPQWLLEAAPSYFKVADPSSINQMKSTQKINPLFNRFTDDQNSWRLSTHSANKAAALRQLGEQ